MKIICCALFALASSPAFAQEKPESALPPAGDPQSEMVRLFNQVETRLREIDRLLSDAGAGDTRALESVGPAGIDELLKRGRSSGEQAVKDIDRILEIAKQMGQQSSGSGSGQGQPQPGGEGQNGKDPLGGQEGNSTERENTPSGPEKGGAQPQGEKPGEQQGGGQPKNQSGEKPGQEKGPKPGEKGDPKDPRANRGDPKNQAGGPPPVGGKDSPSTPNAARDRWGDLPVHARDVFRNEGGRDMPVEYRDWIDEYYRRLNKQSP
ncbi:MAG: hypothetical protein SGI72_08880 [Planctomycetota bacterium]|nr:hypothetical protein [Planctomycetota bacterium]